VVRVERAGRHGWRIDARHWLDPGDDDGWPMAWAVLTYRGLTRDDLMFATDEERAKFFRDIGLFGI
jgi:hypothetical protein